MLGVQIQTPKWRTTTYLKMQGASRTARSHLAVILLEHSMDWSWYNFGGKNGQRNTQILQAISAEMDGWFDKEIISNLCGGMAQVRIGVWPIRSEAAWSCHSSFPNQGLFAVYQQLTKDEKSEVPQIKETLITTFATDRFTACEQFKVCVLCPDQNVDWFAEAVGPFWRNTWQYNGMHICVGTSWLSKKAPYGPQPGRILSILRSCWPELKQFIKDQTAVRDQLLLWCSLPWYLIVSRHRRTQSPHAECNGSNPFARDFMKRQMTTHTHCYRCNKIGHLVRNCLGKWSWGQDVSAGLFPRQQVNSALSLLSTLMVHHAHSSSTRCTYISSWVQSYVDLGWSKTCW